MHSKVSLISVERETIMRRDYYVDEEEKYKNLYNKGS